MGSAAGHATGKHAGRGEAEGGVWGLRGGGMMADLLSPPQAGQKEQKVLSNPRKSA